MRVCMYVCVCVRVTLDTDAVLQVRETSIQKRDHVCLYVCVYVRVGVRVGLDTDAVMNISDACVHR